MPAVRRSPFAVRRPPYGGLEFTVNNAGLTSLHPRLGQVYLAGFGRMDRVHFSRNVVHLAIVQPVLSKAIDRSSPG
ncbi:hypothetical protein [Streptomyces sp. MMG1121]|uniref:hypothetical protein n=1 Tax=Streptomyces sp. MMG1121 TaxID=1415544 RepID=UPI0006AF3945|nr:hypothetical protein [Streptomyces sp. MMG1121]KOV60418.1 hypothetical protein ADK64_29850 [Streptomyces sp. MMG1121]